MKLKPMDNATYATVVELIDAAEDWLVKNGKCLASEADQYVTLEYIACATGIIHGATVYMPNDERIGADIFLTRLPGAKSKLKSTRRQAACVEMLAKQPHLFFPMYSELLRNVFHSELRRIGDSKNLNINGIALLASASLPGAIFDVRRAIRRAGGGDRLLVRNDNLSDRLPRVIEHHNVFGLFPSKAHE